MDPTRHPAGSVCWLDLGISDVDAAVAFYGELGWTVEPPDGTGYRLAGLPGGPVAAFGPAEDPGAPVLDVYVGTADIEASVRVYTAALGWRMHADGTITQADRPWRPGYPRRP